jgi:hypothetical protein
MRLHWLRARAQYNRWAEEVLLTQHEMEWTTRYFMHMANKWKLISALHPDRKGHAAFAAQQIGTWEELGRVADETYGKVYPGYTRIWSSVIN